MRDAVWVKYIVWFGLFLCVVLAIGQTAVAGKNNLPRKSAAAGKSASAEFKSAKKHGKAVRSGSDIDERALLSVHLEAVLAMDADSIEGNSGAGSVNLQPILEAISLNFALGREEKAKALVHAAEGLWAKTDLSTGNEAQGLIRAATVAMYYGRLLYAQAKASGDAGHWQAVYGYCTALVKKYAGEQTKPEWVRAWVYLGDYYKYGPKPNPIHAKKAYKTALTIYDPDFETKWTQIHKKATQKERQEAQEARVSQEAKARNKRRVAALKKNLGRKPAGTGGILSYLSAAMAPTSPFGQDTALGVDPIDNSTDDRAGDLLDAAAHGWYELAMYRYYAFQMERIPEFSPDHNSIPKKVERWWRKTLPADQQKAFYKWREDRARLARWGYLDESLSIREQMKQAKKEAQIEDLDKQFNYWMNLHVKFWIERKAKLQNTALMTFVAAGELHVPVWEMKAAAKVGDMMMEFVEVMRTSFRPPSFRPNLFEQKMHEIYQGAMDSRNNGYLAGAVGAYAHCLNIATKLQLYNDVARYCEQRLHQLEPLKYPVVDEIVSQPTYNLRPLIGETAFFKSLADRELPALSSSVTPEPVTPQSAVSADADEVTKLWYDGLSASIIVDKKLRILRRVSSCVMENSRKYCKKNKEPLTQTYLDGKISVKLTNNGSAPLKLFHWGEHNLVFTDKKNRQTVFGHICDFVRMAKGHEFPKERHHIELQPGETKTLLVADGWSCDGSHFAQLGTGNVMSGGRFKLQYRVFQYSATKVRIFQALRNVQKEKRRGGGMSRMYAAMEAMGHPAFWKFAFVSESTNIKIPVSKKVRRW